MDLNPPEPDAHISRKTPKKGFYSYKSHVVQDADSELIVQVPTTPGHGPEGAVLPTLAQPQAKELSGDKAYGSNADRAHLFLGVAPGLYPRLPGPGRPRKSWGELPQIEINFAECQQGHGLRRTRCWSSAKVTIQTLMVALVVSHKREGSLLTRRSLALSRVQGA